MSSERGGSHAANFSPWHIVAVDDDPKMLAEVSSVLRAAGHVVFGAYSGFAAGEMARSLPDLDLLITNTRMGDMDVAELIRSVRQARPTLAILHIGAELPADDLTAGIPSLREPISTKALLDQVAALLRR